MHLEVDGHHVENLLSNIQKKNDNNVCVCGYMYREREKERERRGESEWEGGKEREDTNVLKY